MINTAILTNSSYKLRFAQDITLYLVEIGLDLEGFDQDAGRKHWLEDPIWQGTRKAIESIMGASDFLEQYLATNLVFEPLVGELFRSGFLMQAAASQGDFATPSVVSAAEAIAVGRRRQRRPRRTYVRGQDQCWARARTELPGDIRGGGGRRP
jgi:propane monooxygenase small subunit